MDKMILKGLEFQACHGVLPREKQEKQPFIVDAVLYLDLTPAGTSDDLNRGIDYNRVYHTIKAVVEKNTFNLIETLAEQVAARLLKDYPVGAVEVTVKKPRAPIAGRFQYVAVHIRRER